MYFDPRALFMLVVLVGVTGWVLKSLMVTWHGLRKGGGRDSGRLAEMEERMRKVETATSSLLVDVSGLREKQRFMVRLQAGADARDNAPHQEQRPDESYGAGPSPMVTQSIPIIPRARSPRA